MDGRLNWHNRSRVVHLLQFVFTRSLTVVVRSLADILCKLDKV